MSVPPYQESFLEKIVGVQWGGGSVDFGTNLGCVETPLSVENAKSISYSTWFYAELDAARAGGSFFVFGPHENSNGGVLAFGSDDVLVQFAFESGNIESGTDYSDNDITGATGQFIITMHASLAKISNKWNHILFSVDLSTQVPYIVPSTPGHASYNFLAPKFSCILNGDNIHDTISKNNPKVLYLLRNGTGPVIFELGDPVATADQPTPAKINHWPAATTSTFGIPVVEDDLGPAGQGRIVLGETQVWFDTYIDAPGAKAKFISTKNGFMVPATAPSGAISLAGSVFGDPQFYLKGSPLQFEQNKGTLGGALAEKGTVLNFIPPDKDISKIPKRKVE